MSEAVPASPSGTTTVPTTVGTPDRPATPAEVDAVIAELGASAPRWCTTGIPERLALLDELRHTTHAAAHGWATSAAAAKGIAPDSHLTGEDWGTGPYFVLRNLQLLHTTLTDIAATGSPQPPRMRTEGARVVVDVVPGDRLDQLIHRGLSAEAWLQPGVTLDQARTRMGRSYRADHERVPGVAVVLGAGNVSAIGPMDALYQLFALDRVVVLKMNPVNAYLGPHLAAAFAPLIDADLLRIVHGGAEVGRHLTEHPDIAAIHITGSDRTHDAIVFGTGDEAEQRRAEGRPRVEVPITSELGDVSPVIVVPGPWSDRDLAFQGDHIASMLVNNAGFNCVAGDVIIQHRAWAGRRALLDAVRDSLRRATAREFYYPGAEERYERFVTAHRQAEQLSDAVEGGLPFTLIPDVDPEAADDVVFTTESFCGVISETALDVPRSVPAFIDEAVRRCNEQLWGNLSATLLVHPRSLADPEVAAAVDRAVEQLHYGTVGVNVWAGISFVFVSPPWGAYAGNELSDIQSGRGTAHNTFLLEDIEKTVIHGPWRPPVTPPWLHTHRRMDRLSPLLADLTLHLDPRKLAAMAWHGLRG
ncbi:MAG: aldehyde dehydrogenase family protein [Nitriliruptoraceae bacterium]